MRIKSLVFLSFCLLPLAACDPDKEPGNDEAGDESGDESETGDPGETEDGETEEQPNDTGDELGESCGEETVTVLTDLEQVPAGFSSTAAEIIADSEGSYAGTFTWFENDGPSVIAHAGTSSPLSMSVAHTGGEVRLVEVELLGEFPNGQDGGSLCGNRLEFEVDFDFATEDGVFAESSVVPISVSSVDPEEGGVAPSIYWKLDMDALGGSLSLDDFSFEGGTITQVILMADFAGDASNGSLAIEVHGDEGSPLEGGVLFGIIAEFEAMLMP
jgi:hypothetical protein